MGKIIEVQVERYRELLRAEAKLDLLENYGVDNWEGYEGALESKEEVFDSIELDIALQQKGEKK